MLRAGPAGSRGTGADSSSRPVAVRAVHPRAGGTPRRAPAGPRRRAAARRRRAGRRRSGVRSASVRWLPLHATCMPHTSPVPEAEARLARRPARAWRRCRCGPRRFSRRWVPRRERPPLRAALAQVAAGEVEQLGRVRPAPAGSAAAPSSVYAAVAPSLVTRGPLPDQPGRASAPAPAAGPGRPRRRRASTASRWRPGPSPAPRVTARTVERGGEVGAVAVPGEPGRAEPADRLLGQHADRHRRRRCVLETRCGTAASASAASSAAGQLAEVGAPVQRPGAAGDPVQSSSRRTRRRAGTAGRRMRHRPCLASTRNPGGRQRPHERRARQAGTGQPGEC